MSDRTMAQILYARFLTIPQQDNGFCRDEDLNEFLKACRGLCHFATKEEHRSHDSAVFFVFRDSSRLYISNPAQRVYPARAHVLD